MSEIQRLADQAEETLHEAQELCKQAQTHLDSTGEVLRRQFPSKLEIAITAQRTLQRQQRLLTTIVDGIEDKAKVTRSKFTEEYDKLVEPALTKLNLIYATLKETPVPKDLISAEIANTPEFSAEDYKNLADFISVDAIMLLKENIGIYKQNASSLIDYLDREVLVATDELKRVKKDFIRLAKHLEKLNLLAHEWGSNTNKYTQLLEENSSLEHKLLLLLSMLTNHFDQCAQAVHDRDTNEADMAILRQDAFELPEVLTEVRQMVTIISTNHDRATKSGESNLSFVDDLIQGINANLQQCRQIKVSIIKLAAIFKAVETRLSNTSLDREGITISPLQQYADVISQLEYYYTNFYNIYKTKYFVELYREKYQYPRAFLDKISRFLNEDLHQMHEEEIQRRKQWVAQYGEFIPRELTLPGEVHIPVVSQVITECLDDVANEMKGGKLQETEQERRLLEFIKSMQT